MPSTVINSAQLCDGRDIISILLITDFEQSHLRVYPLWVGSGGGTISCPLLKRLQFSMIVDNISARHIEGVAWRTKKEPQRNSKRGAMIVFYFIPIIHLFKKTEKERLGETRNG